MLDASDDGPITRIVLGRNGRVERFGATFRKHHVKPPRSPRATITARVSRFVESLGQVRGIPMEGIRQYDERGHLAADSLSGPSDRTYNFVPMSPFCNMEYKRLVEDPIKAWLRNCKSPNYCVVLSVELIYVDYVPTDRPQMIRVWIAYSDDTEGDNVETYDISNK